MKKYKVKKKKSRYGEYLTAKAGIKKSVTGKEGKRMGLLSFSTALLLGVYISALSLGVTEYYRISLAVIAIYYMALAVLFTVYIIINRGISNDIPTPEQLSNDMSDEEKRDFIEDVRRRRDRARPLIYFIMPLTVIVGFDIICTLFLTK